MYGEQNISDQMVSNWLGGGGSLVREKHELSGDFCSVITPKPPKVLSVSSSYIFLETLCITWLSSGHLISGHITLPAAVYSDIKLD